MKKKITLIGAAIAYSLSGQLCAQGLTNMGADDDFYSGLPFTTTLGLDAGWDSNPTSSPFNEDGAEYVRGGINVDYGTGSRTTPIPHFSYDVAFVVIGGWIFHVLDLR